MKDIKYRVLQKKTRGEREKTKGQCVPDSLRLGIYDYHEQTLLFSPSLIVLVPGV